MPWATNPIFRSTNPTEKATTDVEAAQGGGTTDGSATPEPKEDDKLKFLPPSDRFTPHQIFYIFILDGIGSGIFAGGINFAIAYGASRRSSLFFRF